ncbi:hypothetical protein HDU93_005597, partial [Gonapodya sp. JEL0774]
STTGVPLAGMTINALLFADDTALIAPTAEALARLLGICEQWSTEAGMTFSPPKCFLFAPPPAFRSTPLQLYGVDLPSTESHPYLGFPFTRLGINWAKLCEERCEKAKRVIKMFATVGMNVTGWAPRSSAHVYTAFIRPVMEFGIELKYPSRALLAEYQKVQNTALRTIFNVPPNTSIDAMHRVLGIQKFDKRAQELNLLSAGRFHNSADGTVIGNHVWRRRMELHRAAPRSTLPRNTMYGDNPLPTELQDRFIEHRTTPLRRSVPPPRAPSPIATRSERVEWREPQLMALAEDSPEGGVAGAIQVRARARPHAYLDARSRISRVQRVAISRWQLGLVAQHQECRKCGEVLDREHAMRCTQQWDWVEEWVRWKWSGPFHGRTPLDWMLNCMRDKMEVWWAQMAVGVIARMELWCREREMTDQGFFKPFAGD